MAITATDVTTALKPIISESPLGDGEQVINLDSNSFVFISTFVNLFGNAVSISYNDLSTIDAGKLGYSTFLSSWKSKGYIS